MFKTHKIIEKVKQGSGFHLFILNQTLHRMIPFNKPHGIRVTKLSDTSLKTIYPYKKRNLNHIKGLHACGLATLSEFTTGLLLSFRMDMKKYRLIMQSMEVTYKYQGKMDAYAEFEISDGWLKEHVLDPLAVDEKVVVPCTIDTHDEKGNILCTAVINWQIKNWQKVKTAL